MHRINLVMQKRRNKASYPRKRRVGLGGLSMLRFPIINALPQRAHHLKSVKYKFELTVFQRYDGTTGCLRV
jgi:hypothetical protein